MFRKLATIPSLLLLVYIFAFSSEYGFYAGIGYSRLEGDFRQFRALQDSIPFIGSGSTAAFGIGAFWNVPLSNSIFISSSFGLNYSSFPLAAERDLRYGFDSTKVQTKYILFMNAKLQYNSLKLTVSPNVNFKVFKNFSLVAGFSVGYEVLNLQKIRYTEEDYIKGASISVQHQEYETEGKHKFPITFLFNVGIDYQIPRNFFGLFKIGVAPYFSFGFNNVAKDFTADATNFGVNLKFYPEKIKKVKPPKEPLLPPLDSLPPTLAEPITLAPEQVIEEETSDSVELQFVGIKNENGKDVYVPANLIISKTRYEVIVPLLNYVFYEYGSSEIPRRYHLINSMNEFDVTRLKGRTILETYYEILNIIGYRLRQNPNAKITLVGCNSDIGEEAKNQQLSQRRAENIAKYLQNVWEIEPERIEIQARNLPAKPSNPKLPEGNSENQRVEILSNDLSILSPIVLLDSACNVAPDYIRVFAKIHSKAADWSWSIGSFFRDFAAIEKRMNIPVDSLDLGTKFLCNRALSLPVADFELTFFSNSDTARNIKRFISLPIVWKETVQDTAAMEKLVLPYFDFNSSEIKPIQKEFISKFKDKFAKAKRITLIGHTDVIGSPEYNLHLSQERIEAISKLLIESGFIGNAKDHDEYSDEKQIVKEPVGAIKQIFDNKLPEGRFFSRTVEILIEY
jgi:outer membrane protein OmpA-like peptidoglycan-associated protein